MAYYSVEPFGQDRQDFGHAQTTAAIINAFHGKGPAAKTTDFMPRFEQPSAPAKPRQSTEEMQEVFRRAARNWGGRKK